MGCISLSPRVHWRPLVTKQTSKYAGILWTRRDTTGETDLDRTQEVAGSSPASSTSRIARVEGVLPAPSHSHFASTPRHGYQTGTSASPRIGPSGPPKDVVGSNSAPDDVRLTSNDLAAVCERRSAVTRPSDLPHPRLALDAFDPKLRRERLACQTGDEQTQRVEECLPLLGSESLPVSKEARQLLMRRQSQSGSAAGALLRCAMKSSVLRKTVPEPLAISTSASRSPLCHVALPPQAVFGNLARCPLAARVCRVLTSRDGMLIAQCMQGATGGGRPARLRRLCCGGLTGRLPCVRRCDPGLV